MTLRKGGRWLVGGGWLLPAALIVSVVAFSGIDPASTILLAVGLLTVAAALLCLGRAIAARGVGTRIVWIGRALGLLGAAWAISFPAELYQEVVMVFSRGETPAAWFPRAIWYSAATIPLIVVPALVALSWPRLGGMLFLIDGLFNIVESLYRPFGMIFPEATSSGWIGVPALDLFLQPAFITAALLLVGSIRAASDRRVRGSLLSPVPGS